MTTALDSSALLTVVFGEPGAEKIAPLVRSSSINAVNLSEVVGKMVEQGWTDEDVRRILNRFRMKVSPFDRELAVETGLLRGTTRKSGLSLGDRACLAAAMRENARVLTADRAWVGLDVGVEIEVIR